MADWFDGLREKIRTEMGTTSLNARAAFQEVIRRPVPPSPQEQVHEFLSWSPEYRQQLLNQLGPEGYRNLIADKIDEAAKVIGDSAYRLIPYFENDMNAAQQMPQVAPVADIQNPSVDSMIDEALQGMNNGGTQQHTNPL